MNRREWFRRSGAAGGAVVLTWLMPPPACGQARAPSPEDESGFDVLLFDVFGTVVEWRTSLTRRFERFGRTRGLAADWGALVARWQAGYMPSLEAVRGGRRPFVDLEVLRRETLDRLLPDFGLGALDDADRGRMVRGWRRLDPWPDAVAGLSRLKRKFIIATLSNGGVGQLVEMAKYAGLPWDAVLSAAQFRHFKPDAEVYRGAAELLGRPPGSLTLVAAHNGDLGAARACGLRTAYVQRPTEDAGPSADWDIIARDFLDLASRLGS
jgi:2-haloacid dehalogenase